MSNTPSYHGYRFPPEIISYAVWLYHRFCLSFRDVEDLLAELDYRFLRDHSAVVSEVRPRVCHVAIDVRPSASSASC